MYVFRHNEHGILLSGMPVTFIRACSTAGVIVPEMILKLAEENDFTINLRHLIKGRTFMYTF